MNKKRDRLCPMWLSLTIGSVVVAALAAAYPRADVQTRTLSSQPASMVSVAYLEAWLLIKPDSPLYLESLAMQLLELGRWEAALDVSRRLASTANDNTYKQKAIFLELVATEQMAYALPAKDPLRAQDMAQLVRVLHDATQLPWNVAAMSTLAEKARSIGADDAMVAFYHRLAVADSKNSAQWWARLGEVALSTQAYETAAFSYFSAHDNAHTLDDKRQYFIRALQVFESANRVDQACTEAEKRIGALSTDGETLRYLLRLARQADRTDLITRYARALLRNADTLPKAPAPRHNEGPKILLVATGAGAATVETNVSADVAALEEEYKLVYQAFIESSALDDAQQVAQMALQAGMDPVAWSARLAEVAQWNNRPDIALKAWLLNAQSSNDPQVWQKVLALAPLQDNDDAYMAAWAQRQTTQANAALDATAGLNALAAEYMKAGHWVSLLRVAERLKADQGDPVQQRTLMLQMIALEKQAYEFKPDDPQRANWIRRLHDVMEENQRYPWDLTGTKWMAQKARETGADGIMLHYYRQLTKQDTGNAAQWQAKLADFELGRQAYDAAALAYFSAQELAGTPEEKGRYFQAGLAAYVANGKVALACTEGEQRVGDLMEDPSTLRYLISLARQAHRTDLMARYARELIRVTQESRKSTSFYDDTTRGGFLGQGTVPGVWQASTIPLAQHALFRASDTPRRFNMADATGANSSPNDSTARAQDLEVAFQAFVESRQLNDAETTAQQALEEGLDPGVWAPRLAQIAEWNNHPKTALRYWLQHAQASGSPQAWASVLRLSEQLRDSNAQLAALRYLSSRSPGDMALLDRVVQAYEMLGQPEAGMAYLRSRAHGSMRVPMLERYGELATRSGHDDAARKVYTELMHDGPNPYLYAARVASMDYAQGNLDAALVTLREVREVAGTGPKTITYWRLYSEVATLAQSSEDATFANQQLLATGQASDADLTTLAYLYEMHPIDGGRIAEAQFQKNGSPVALQSALNLYTDARAWARIQMLLDGLSPEQQDYFLHSGTLLMARAQYYAATQQWEPALADLLTATTMPDATDRTRITYLWALTNFGTSEALNKAMHQWQEAARNNPEYWGVLAAAELRLGNALSAARYLRRQRLTEGDDPLWMMALADAEDASGHAERARGIRKQAWVLLQKKVTAQKQMQKDQTETGSHAGSLFEPPVVTARTYDAARIALSQALANGDYSRALLIQLLEEEARSSETTESQRSVLGENPGLPALAEVSPAAAAPDGSQTEDRTIGPTVKEAVLSWALGGEHNELARAWLAIQYGDPLLRPIDSEISLALATRDKETVSSLLDDGRKNISIENRIDALAMTGRLEEAQTLAFQSVEGAPENDARHQRMADTFALDRSGVGTEVKYVDTDPLEYVQTVLTGGLQLTSRWGIGLEAINRNQKTSDTSVLAWVPSHDREFNVTLHNTTPDRKFSLTVGARDAWDSFYTVSLRADLNRQGEFKTSFLLGLNQFTDITQELQVAGVKDLAQMLVQWEPETLPWFAWGSAEISRIHDQDRTYAGRGLEFTADLGYRIMPTHPDWSVRLTATRGIYSASDNQLSALQDVVPASFSLAASDNMPQNFTQYGVMVGFGVSEPNAYWRRWRLFMDAGYVHDSQEGWGPVVNLGAGGSVLGGDHLRIFYMHTAARKGDGRASSQIGLSYRLFF